MVRGKMLLRRSPIRTASASQHPGARSKEYIYGQSKQRHVTLGVLWKLHLVCLMIEIKMSSAENQRQSGKSVIKSDRAVARRITQPGNGLCR